MSIAKLFAVNKTKAIHLRAYREQCGSKQIIKIEKYKWKDEGWHEFEYLNLIINDNACEVHAKQLWYDIIIQISSVSRAR